MTFAKREQEIAELKVRDYISFVFTWRIVSAISLSDVEKTISLSMFSFLRIVIVYLYSLATVTMLALFSQLPSFNST